MAPTHRETQDDHDARNDIGLTAFVVVAGAIAVSGCGPQLAAEDGENATSTTAASESPAMSDEPPDGAPALLEVDGWILRPVSTAGPRQWREADENQFVDRYVLLDEVLAR